MIAELLLTTASPDLTSVTPERVLRLLGRLHPVVVHFPVALLLVAAMAEAWRSLGTSRRAPFAFSIACVAIASLASGVAAWFGWLSAAHDPLGSSVASTVFLHRWLGIALAGTAVVALAAGLLARRRHAFVWAYRALLFAGAGLVGYVGHLGGILVHGEGRYVEALFPPAATIAEQPPPGGLLGLDADVLKIFEARCVECHGPAKKKGGLRLDSLTLATEDDFVVMPGDPDSSELFLRIVLPRDHDDAMPPEGDPLTPDEIERIRGWILLLGLRGETEARSAPREAERPTGSPAIDARSIDDALRALRAIGVAASRVSDDDARIDVNASVLGSAFRDEHLLLLDGLEAALRRLDLSGTSITDDGLATLAGFHAVERLLLNRTGVSGRGVSSLSGWPHLKSLGLFATAITDDDLTSLLGFHALRRVYLASAGVTPSGIDSLAAAAPHLEIERAAAFPPSEPLATVTVPDCCKRAQERGNECDHPCCIQARSSGMACERCLGGG